VITTQSDGRNFEFTVTRTETQAPTEDPQPTSDDADPKKPGKQDQANAQEEESGLSPDKRNIVIGVLVGVGGAILLGGLIIVVWRHKKAKRERAMDDDIDLGRESPYGGAGGDSRKGSAHDQSPFQATLDQYHKPQQPVTAASNF